MCVTCGCSDGDAVIVVDVTPADASGHAHAHAHDHDHDHDHSHAHGHEHSHSHDFVHAQVHTHGPAARGTTLSLEQAVLAKNQLAAERNRGWFAGRGILALNLMSSPGAGKATLLERTIRDCQTRVPISVIEGDQATVNDARRILERCIENARSINPRLRVLQVSAESGEGLAAWYEWLDEQVRCTTAEQLP